MLIKLIEIKRVGSSYELNDVYVNPKYVVYMTEDDLMKKSLLEGKINLPIDRSACFTKITINESDRTYNLIAVGTPSSIESKFFNKKKLLRG